MASWELDGDGEPNDGKGVIVVQGWMVRKGRIPGLTTTSCIRTESDHERNHSNPKHTESTLESAHAKPTRHYR